MFPAGSTIEVKIKNPKGEVISEWHSLNAYPASVITASFVGITIVVTDDAANTFTKIEEGMILLAQNDAELFDWIMNASGPRAGSFVRAIADAARAADHENYALLRPVLLEFRRKYPAYDRESGESSGSSGL